MNKSLLFRSWNLDSNTSTGQATVFFSSEPFDDVDDALGDAFDEAVEDDASSPATSELASFAHFIVSKKWEFL